jgi:ornithine cyclodeaminase/alanine dehydrogenase-like protein (mu-crystallin family)
MTLHTSEANFFRRINLETIVLTEKEIEEMIKIEKVMEVVEEAFRGYPLKKFLMPPKIYLEHPEHRGDFRAMLASDNEMSLLKWVNSHSNNPVIEGLPAVMAVIILSNSKNGYPLAIMGGRIITKYRTGASAAIASKYLALGDASRLGLIGCGQQAYTQLMAIS